MSNFFYKSFLILSTFVVTLNANAQTNYYISSSDGDDSNSGISPNNAWETTSKFNGINFNEGDIIHFKKGDIWKGSYLFLDKGITIKSYGSETEKPVISNIDTLNLCWTEHGQKNGVTVWKAITENTISRLIVNNEEVLKSTLFDDLGKKSMGIGNVETQQKWFYESTYSVLFLVSDIDPSNFSIKSSIRYYTMIGTNTDDVIIEDIEVRGGYGPSIWLRDSDNIQIKNCTIGKYAETGILMSGDCDNANIKDNIIDSGWDSSLTYGTNNVNENISSKRGVGDGINFVGGVHHSFITNNEIRNWGHTGIEFLGVDNSLYGVNNNHVSSNIVITNTSYGRAIGIDGILDKCKGNVFRYNRIENCKSPIQFNGNNNTFHHNIVKGTKNSPCKPSSLGGFGIEMSIYGNNFVCQSIRIDNNIFVENDLYGISVNNYYDSLGSQVFNIYIRNNIILDNYKSDALNNNGILIKDFNSILDVRIQNNLLYDSMSPSDDLLIDYRGNEVSPVSGTAVGIDTFENNLHANPDFVDMINYEVNSISSCIDNGVSVEYEPYATDFDGDSFPVAAPDIGAQEYQSTSSTSISTNDDLKINLINTDQEKNDLTLFPNPSKGILNIESNEKIESIKVFDINGKQIYLETDVSKHNLNIRYLESGIYMLEIKTPTTKYLRRVIKK